MKKAITILTITAMGAMIAGCGNQNTAQNSNRNESESSQQAANSQPVNSTSASSSSHHDEALWNNQKDEQLASFMEKWGPTMHQSYERYDGHNAIKVITGVTYPTDFSQEQVEGQAGLIGWAPTGKGDYEYNVVAIYNHDGTEPPENRITYFFAFHNGKPIVLVDQSTNGYPDCQPTHNTDLQSNFERIANQ